MKRLIFYEVWPDPETPGCLCGAELAITHLPLTCPHCHRMWLKES